MDRHLGMFPVTFSFFLIRHGGLITCEITGHRMFGLGLEVPNFYKPASKHKYIKSSTTLRGKENKDITCYTLGSSFYVYDSCLMIL